MGFKSDPKGLQFFASMHSMFNKLQTFVRLSAITKFSVESKQYKEWETNEDKQKANIGWHCLTNAKRKVQNRHTNE